MRIQRSVRGHPELRQLRHQHQWKMETAYALPLIREGSSAYVRNVETEVQLLQAGRHLLPITVNYTGHSNSYVCSPYSTYVRYAQEELDLLQSRLLKKNLGAVIGGIGPLLKKAGIDQNVHANNWLLSTNLYEPIEGEVLRELPAA